ncbi:MAG: C10 family peptidase [Bacteroidales bacterium]|nr:C10 family peptidase [Bacteroidales bacterium]
MKNVFCIFVLAATVLMPQHQGVVAQQVSRQESLMAASNYISHRQPELSPTEALPLISGNDTLAWLIHCLPQGFIVTSSDRSQKPIVAWSAEGNFGEGEVWISFLPVFMKDLKLRYQYSGSDQEELTANLQAWNNWLNPSSETLLFEQWPPEGWSSTGGWLFTNWTQTAPYNAYCPIDGQTQNRSVAGCPATAMAQIVNFHHKLNDTRFDDADDYYHNFGTGNMYWIDNDWQAHEFPSWNDLNVLLDTVDAHYENGIPLSNFDKAALTYACGAAAKQVYSSSVSGTYGINQAYDAFIRFGYNDAQLIYPSNPGLSGMLSGNIKLALPAHLGLVNPEETVGHNVVVDGYNTDELYHFNFGWGGSANGWYTMPPKDIPYDLTVIEGVVLDINLSNPPVAIDKTPASELKPEWSYNKNENRLIVQLPDQTDGGELAVFDATGRMISYQTFSGLCGSIRILHTESGIFLGRLRLADGRTSTYKFIR